MREEAPNSGVGQQQQHHHHHIAARGVGEGGGSAHVLHVRPEWQNRHRECRLHQAMPRCTGQAIWQNLCITSALHTYIQYQTATFPIVPTLALSPYPHNYTEEKRLTALKAVPVSKAGNYRLHTARHEHSTTRHQAAAAAAAGCGKPSFSFQLAQINGKWLLPSMWW